ANVRTGVSITTTTNASGNYEANDLLPGTYTLTFSKPGFKVFVQKNVAVVVGTSTPLNPKLQVGAVTQNVTVSAAPPLLDTGNAEVTTHLSSQVIESIPISGRNFTNIEELVPGTVRNSFQHPLNEDPSDDLLVNTNGQEYAANNFMIDGAGNNDVVLGISILTPPLDDIQEAKITTGNYDAQFAQAGGSVIQVQTKSGTNQVHGSAFEFLQNNVFEARDPFTEGLHAPGTPAPAHSGIPELNFNQFGGSLGGPIKKDKLFWFFDWQTNRENLGGEAQTRVPTAAERSGDLSDLGVDVYNPLTGDINGNGRTLFTGATIPSTMISPQASKLLSFLPMPNIAGASGPGPNYAATGVNNYDTNQFDVRIDDYATDKLNFFGRYSYEGVNVLAPGAFGLYGGPTMLPPGVSIYSGHSQDLLDNGVLGVNYVFSPTFLADFRFAASRYRIIENPLDINQNLATQVGIPGINIPQLNLDGGLPNIDLSGAGAINGSPLLGYACNCPLRETENVFQWIGNWTKIVGNHTIKWGAEVQAAQDLRLPSDNHRAGVYNFNPSTTSSPSVTGSGSGLASLLLGDPGQFQRFAQISTNQQDRQKRLFTYGQDTWRVTHKLTINYGLRWDTWFPDTSLHVGQGGRYEIANNFVYIPGIGGVSQSGGVRTRWANFSPRFAIAYAINPRTVIRTGWARSYYQGTFGWNFNDLDADIYPSIVNQNILPSNSFFPVEFVAGATPGAPSLGTAPPPPVFPTIPSSGLLPLANGISTPYIPVTQPIPYVDSYNFTVEHAFSNGMTLSVAYVGNQARDLNMGWNMNEPIPGPGPFTPRQPYFKLFGLTQTIFDKCDCEGGNYDGLQIQATKRFTKNLSFVINYSWNRAFDYGETGTPFDQLNTKLNYGPDTYNEADVLTIGHTYQLPIGHGQRWLSGVSGPLSQIVSGWQWSGFTTLASGEPFSATLSNASNLNSEMGEQPNKIGNPFANTPHNRTQWFNPAAFATPGLYLFGNASRDALTGPPIFSANWSLDKNFRVTERANLRFSWEVYNVFNYTNLCQQAQGCLNSQTDTPTAGQITDINIYNPMRNMQFGLHLTW
ncbi:MAG: TonB-dependent receptor domain-containing protein, partial [Terriglobia bacterium]